MYSQILDCRKVTSNSVYMIVKYNREKDKSTVDDNLVIADTDFECHKHDGHTFYIPPQNNSQVKIFCSPSITILQHYDYL